MSMRKIIAALALLSISSAALAQSIQLQPGQVLGNPRATQGPGTGTTVEALQKISTPEQYGGSCATADNGPAIQLAVNAAGTLPLGPGIVQLSPCAYQVITPVVDPYGVRLLGASDGGSFFSFSPASANQIGYRRRKAGFLSTGGGIENVFFYTNDTTRTKTAIEIEDVSHYVLRNVRVGGATIGLAAYWGGAGSIGLRYRGREFLYTDNVFIAADKPLVLSDNPNSTIDADYGNFSGMNLIANGFPNVTIDDAINLTRNNFSNMSLNGGTHCIFWNNATGTLPSDGNTFHNIGCEQGTDATAYSYYIHGNVSGGLIRNTTFTGYHLMDSARNGISLRYVQGLDAMGASLFNQSPGTFQCLDTDNTVFNLSWGFAKWDACSQTLFSGQKLIAAASLETGMVLPRWALYNSDTQGSAFNIGRALTMPGQSSGLLTIVPQAVAGTPVFQWPTVSGTFVSGGASPLVCNAITGQCTCPTCVTSSGGGAITGTPPISVSAGGAVSLDNAGVTYAKIQNLGALALMGRSANSSGVGADIQATAASDAVFRESGSTIGFGTIATGGIANGAVTSAKLNADVFSTAHTWALAQTFTVAPVFTDQSGSRTALGLGTMATQAASAVAITGGTIAGLTGLAIRDTSAAFDLTIAATSSASLSAGRTLTLNMGNVAHTLAFGATANTITFPNLASFTVITNGDTGTVTNAMLAGSIAASKLVGTDIATVGTLTAGTASTGFVLGGVIVMLGSDATGDIHYRNSGGVFTRLGIGSTGNVLTVAGGLPSWAAPAAAAAGSLTGSTLAAGVTASSLTSLGTITSLTATTINAFTLGGNISGGGNQINNIVIGTSTPLAGTFTTLAGTTSVTSPLHYGGSSAGSTATLSGTSNGSPSSAYVLLQSGTTQFVGINNATPKTTLDINKNTASSPALVVSSSIARMQSADTANGGMEWVSYGSANGNFLVGSVAGGTSASPTATPASRNMFNLQGYGWNGSAWALGAIIAMQNPSLWSGSSQATQIDFYTTPGSSTTIALAASILSTGGLLVGSGSLPGAGQIAAQNGFIANNISGISKACTIAVGQVLTFTLGILTATSGTAGCV